MSGTDRSNILASLMAPNSAPMRQAEKENSARLPDQRRPMIGNRPTSGASSTGGGRQHKLKQRFTVIRKLGKGTYGKVQLAINKETGQEVAIKTIKKTKIENEQDLQRVRREIQIMSSIEHPHIIHIYEVFENKDKIVLVMQYAPGGELYEYVSQAKLLDDSEARRLFRQIATAIYYCHQNKICHRDLKLENILLDEKNNAKLADFGLSNVFDKHRQLKTFCGSPLYASPEIVQGSPYEGPEVDCWSLGVLLYTLVYGAMPFDGSNFKRLVKQISEACYFEPKQKSLASPLIRRLLCADPNLRATILDICSDSWVNGVGVPATVAAAALQSPGQQAAQSHNSLLKVAQDMANLTPVRFDMLLALTPTSPPVAARAPDGRPPLSRIDSNSKSGPQPTAGAQPRAPTTLDTQSIMEVDEDTRAASPVASYVVRDLEPGASVNGSTVTAAAQAPPESELEVGRPNLAEPGESPVVEEEMAELIVEQELISVDGVKVSQYKTSKDSDDIAMQVHMDNDSATKTKDTSAQQPPAEQLALVEMANHYGENVNDDKVMEHSAITEGAAVSKQTSQSLAEPQMHTTSLEINQLDTLTDSPAPSVSMETVQPGDSNEPVVKMEVDSHRDELSIEPTDQAIQIDGEQKSQVDDDQHMVPVESRVAPTATTSEISDGATEKGAPSEVKEGDEEKPKKVKKKIIVRKKKKISKREAPTDEAQSAELSSPSKQEKDKQEKDKSTLDKAEGGRSKIDCDTNEQEAAAAADTAGGQGSHERQDGGGTKPAAKGAKGSGGPGKVRIPDTFQASGNGDATTTTSSSSKQQTPPKGEGQRRQSTLVADVSQKLIQQAEQSSKSSSSSAANIQADQPQLSSVRVSDKKSEFERRASLAQVAGAGPSTLQQPAAAVVSAKQHEPQRLEGLIESLKMLNSLEQTIVEPVSKLEALEVSKPAAIVVKSKSQGAQAATGVKVDSGQVATISDEDRRSPNTLEATPLRDDRSDSVETIKAEPQSGWPGEALETEQQSDGDGDGKGVRSVLKIDLKSRGEQQKVQEQQQKQHHQWQRQQQPLPMSAQTPTSLTGGAQMIALGPAPIARSYKKVTFTKDGACITETGKIYSAQADDGTVRRIERKSKITHYPASSGGESGEQQQAAISASEETHVYDDDGRFAASRMWQEAQSSASSSFQAAAGASSSRRSPFERLMMPPPASGAAGFPDLDDLDDVQLEPNFMHHQQQQRLSPFARHYQQQQRHPMESQFEKPIGRTDSASSCSSGSTDVFDDIFDTWTGAISMFDQNSRHFLGLQQPPLLPQLPAMFSGSPVRRHSRKSAHLSSRVSSSLAGTPRCESVEPQFMSPQKMSGPNTRKQSSGQQQYADVHGDWPPAQVPTTATMGANDLSGYDSDVPARRPASALGSARGRFGSSNLYHSAAGPSYGNRFAEQDPFDSFFDHSSDPFGDNLFRNIEQEHQSMRQRLAKQHKQLWKGSTPSLFAPSESTHQQHQQGGFSDLNFNQAPYQQHTTRRRQQGLWQYLRPQESLDDQLKQHQVPRPKSGLGSQTSQAQQQQQWPSSSQKPPAGKSEETRQQQQTLEQSQSSSSFMRKSVALDSAPTRRNTANLTSLPAAAASASKASAAAAAVNVDQLSSRQQFQPMRRSISRTSLITSQMANVQLAGAGSPASEKQVSTSERHSTASFIELKRTSSSASTFQQIQERMQQQQQQQTENSNRIVSSSKQMMSTSSSASAFWDGRTVPMTTSSSDTAQQQFDPEQRARLELSIQENRESRIQSWLCESSGNLSTSSGSKSSASDVRSQANRGEQQQQQTASLYATLRPQKRQQAAGIMPPTSPLAKTSQQQQQQQIVGDGSNLVDQSDTSAMLFSSCSRQSMNDTVSNSEQHHHQTIRHQVQMSGSTPLDSGLSTLGSSQLTKATSSTKVSKATFTLRQKSSPLIDDDDDEDDDDDVVVVDSAAIEMPFTSEGCIVKQVQQVQQQHHVSSSSSFSKVSSTSATAPIDSKNSDGLQWIQTKESSNSRLFGNEEFDDSLSGGDLGSQSSSSLLDQLRSRGYRSMINQRMVSSQQQQQQAVEKSSSSITSSTAATGTATTTTAKAASSTVVESCSSSRIITTSSSTTSGSTKTVQQQQQVFRSSTQESRLDTMSPKVVKQQEPKDNFTGSVTITTSDSPQVPSAPVFDSSGDHAPARSNGVQLDAKQENNEDEMDEYVREAKANIKAHLDRIKETELFLKSMHQEEEIMQRQRQELFLFNNLMLSSKLNGIRSKQMHMSPSQADDWCAPAQPQPVGIAPNQESSSVLVGSHMSAPIRGGYNFTHSIHSEPAQPTAVNMQETSAISMNGLSSSLLMFEPTYTIPSSIQSPTYMSRRSLQSECQLVGNDTTCGLYNRPLTATASMQQLHTTPLTINRNPLEPVQPLSIYSEPPIMTTTTSYTSSRDCFDSSFGCDRSPRRRSRSQLSDQFQDYKRRPLSANVDDLITAKTTTCGEVSSSANAYFPSRARRSTSQLRYSTTASNGCSSFGRSSIMSEYKSAYGNLASPDGSSSTINTARDAATADRNNDSEDDDGMSAYRASTYVPKIVPQGMPSRSARSYQRRSTGPIVATSDSWRKERESSPKEEHRFKASRGSKLSLASSYADPDDDLPPVRRTSLQQVGQNSYTHLATSALKRNSSPVSCRRRSVGITTGPSVGSSAGDAPTTSANETTGASGSRLSKLEQRLAENKRRREELLACKLAPQPKESCYHSETATSRNVRSSKRLSGASGSFDNDGNVISASVSDERLSNSVNAATSKSDRAREVSPAPSTSPRPTVKFSRPSRLESMEARIKRKSYCVRVGQCSPERAQLRGQQSLDRRRTQPASSLATSTSGGHRRNSHGSLRDETTGDDYHTRSNGNSNGNLLQSVE